MLLTCFLIFFVGVIASIVIKRPDPALIAIILVFAIWHGYSIK
jgi:hypothetical protein